MRYFLILSKAAQLELFGAPVPGQVRAHTRKTPGGKVVRVPQHASGHAPAAPPAVAAPVATVSAAAQPPAAAPAPEKATALEAWTIDPPLTSYGGGAEGTVTLRQAGGVSKAWLARIEFPGPFSKYDLERSFVEPSTKKGKPGHQVRTYELAALPDGLYEFATGNADAHKEHRHFIKVTAGKIVAMTQSKRDAKEILAGDHGPEITKAHEAYTALQRELNTHIAEGRVSKDRLNLSGSGWYNPKTGKDAWDRVRELRDDIDHALRATTAAQEADVRGKAEATARASAARVTLSELAQVPLAQASGADVVREMRAVADSMGDPQVTTYTRENHSASSGALFVDVVIQVTLDAAGAKSLTENEANRRAHDVRRAIGKHMVERGLVTAGRKVTQTKRATLYGFGQRTSGDFVGVYGVRLPMHVEFKPGETP